MLAKKSEKVDLVVGLASWAIFFGCVVVVASNGYFEGFLFYFFF